MEKKKRDYLIYAGMTEHKCAKCGKPFECREQYRFKKYNYEKKHTDYWCCWTCYSKRGESDAG